MTDGGWHTLFLVAPSHEQERLQSAFVALLSEVLHAAFATADRNGEPLDPGLLIVLDEAANIAPLADLDTIVATAAGHGIQMLTVWQDFAQIEARYGPKSATIVSNHRAKVLCSGISDPATLEKMSALIGDEERVSDTTTTTREGQWSTTRSLDRRRLASAHTLRQLPFGQAVLLYGHLPPAVVTLAGSLRRRCRPVWRWPHSVYGARRH